MKIKFYLNERLIEAEINPAKPLLDYLRKEEHLTSVKVVCREGDCGACTVLVGEINDGVLKYKNVASCLFPLGNVAGKHIVTLEGLNGNGLNLIQQAFAEEGAAQCGFCTPGYISSLTSFLISTENITFDNALNSIAGNICRCTGYASIKRAVEKIIEKFNEIDFTDVDRIKLLIDKNILPEYFLNMEERLRKIRSNELRNKDVEKVVVAGGTDLFVQKPSEIIEQNITLVDNIIPKQIFENEKEVVFSGNITFADFFSYHPIKNLSLKIKEFEKLIASELIRNVGTLAGNIVNASPIGDLSIILLALDAKLTLENTNGNKREVSLSKFYSGYKQIDMQSNEIISSIAIPKENLEYYFNFEKVSKRKYLDIASVNSAALINVEDGIITKINISAGGVYPYPKNLTQTSDYLLGKEISSEFIANAVEVAQNEISPISDIRGSKEYKSFLLGRLIIAHFVELFPNRIEVTELI